MTTKTLSKNDLGQFTGSDNWYQHGLNRKVTYTDGAKYVAETGGAYWLLDEIALNQLQPEVKAEEFQLWTLKVTGSKAILTCDDGNGNIVFSKKIEYTDFPLDEIKFYFCNNVIHLPSKTGNWFLFEDCKMTNTDAVERYGTHPMCDFCFFGIVVAGKCTSCDGRDAVDKALAALEEEQLVCCVCLAVDSPDVRIHKIGDKNYCFHCGYECFS